MPKLIIDKKEINVPDNYTILDAARKLDIDIPTMCFKDGIEHFTSCMVCLVKDLKTGRLIPSCSLKVQDGMEIDTSCEEVKSARRTAIELLLSDHLGDCSAPCTVVCPAHMNIPLMIRQIGEGKMHDALVTVKEHIPFPSIIGRICPAPCEKGCRRNKIDEGVSICLLKQYAGDKDLESGNLWVPSKKPASGKSVAIVGGGIAGLATAYYLLLHGHACKIFEASDKIGGMLRTKELSERLPENIIDTELDTVKKLGAEIQTNCKIGKDISMEQLNNDFDAVVLTVGKTQSEELNLFGVKTSAKGIVVDKNTFQTDNENIFAGGSVVQVSKMAVRSVAHGKAIAESVNQKFVGQNVIGIPTRFNSTIGAIKNTEKEIFLSLGSSEKRQKPSNGKVNGFTQKEAIDETKRCLHCDCRKPQSCKLRTYADRYGANMSTYKNVNRKEFRQIKQQDVLIYEPGKCIKCGLCVRITSKYKEKLGLTFIGRGFDIQISVPFNASLEKGLEKTAKECVNACPTGALAFVDKEELA